MATRNWADMVNEDKEARTPAPAGRYVMEVVKAKLGHKKDHPEIPQWSLTLQVAEGAQKGKAAFLRLTFDGSNASMRMAFDNIRKLGIDPGAQDLLVESASSTFEGKRAEVELQIREWNGNINNDVKNIIKPLVGTQAPAGAGAPPPKASTAAPVNPLAKPKAI